MALIDVVTTDFGVDVAYWNIARYEDFFAEQRALITLAGYVDAQARQDGKHPILNEMVEVTTGDYIAEAPRAELYAFLKTLPRFASAQDA